MKRFVPQRSLRVVLDTNVLVSGTIVRHGFPGRILVAVLDERITLVVSPYLLAEYLNVIQRPHIAKKYPNLSDWLVLVRRFISANAISVSPTSVPRVIQDDPKDDAILACALTGGVQYIVSGDQHLLKLGSYHGIEIVTPREFVVKVLKEAMQA